MNAKSGIWTEEEDRKLLEGYYRFGHQWTQIARYIGNRTDNAVKNRWSVLMRKCNDSDDERAAARGQSAEGPGKKKMKDERAEDNEDAELQRHCKKPCLRISVPSALRSFGTRCCTEPQHNFFFLDDLRNLCADADDCQLPTQEQKQPSSRAQGEGLSWSFFPSPKLFSNQEDRSGGPSPSRLWNSLFGSTPVPGQGGNAFSWQREQPGGLGTSPDAPINESRENPRVSSDLLAGDESNQVAFEGKFSGSGSPPGTQSNSATPSIMKSFLAWSGLSATTADKDTPAIDGWRSFFGENASASASPANPMSAPASVRVSARQSYHPEYNKRPSAFADPLVGNQDEEEQQQSTSTRNSILQKLVDVRSAIARALRGYQSLILDPAADEAGLSVPQFSQQELNTLAGTLSPPAAYVEQSRQQ